MEEPSFDWKSEEYSSYCRKTKMGWILNKGLDMGKKIVITGIAVSSAPFILPPLLFYSAFGFAFSVPSGLFIASYACSEKLMSKLLYIPNYPPPLLDYGDDDITDYEDKEDSELNREVVMKEEEEEQIKDMREGVKMRFELTENENEGREQGPREDAMEVKGKEEMEEGNSECYLNKEESSCRRVIVAEGDERNDTNMDELIEGSRAILQESGGDEKVIAIGEENNFVRKQKELIDQIKVEEMNEAVEKHYKDEDITDNEDKEDLEFNGEVDMNEEEQMKGMGKGVDMRIELIENVNKGDEKGPREDAKEALEEEEKEEGPSECPLEKEESRGKPVVVAERDARVGSNVGSADEHIEVSRGIARESRGEEMVIDMGERDNLLRRTTKLMEEIGYDGMNEEAEKPYEDEDVTHDEDKEYLQFNAEFDMKNEKEEQMKDMGKGVNMGVGLIENVSKGDERETPKDEEEVMKKEEKDKVTRECLSKKEESKGKPVVVAEGDECGRSSLESGDEPIEMARGIVQESGGEEKVIDSRQKDNSVGKLRKTMEEIRVGGMSEEVEKRYEDEDTDNQDKKDLEFNREVDTKKEEEEQMKDMGKGVVMRIELIENRNDRQEQQTPKDAEEYMEEVEKEKGTGEFLLSKEESRGKHVVVSEGDERDGSSIVSLDEPTEVSRGIVRESGGEEKVIDIRVEDNLGRKMRKSIKEVRDEGMGEKVEKQYEGNDSTDNQDKENFDLIGEVNMKNEEVEQMEDMGKRGEMRIELKETLKDAEEIMEKEEKEEDTSECSLKEEEIKGKPVVVAEGDECGGSSFERVDEPIVMSRGVVQESGGEEGVINFGAEDNLVKITRKLMEEIRDEQMSEGVGHAYEDKDITDSQDGNDLEFNGEVNKKNEEEEQMKDMRQGVEMRIELIEDVNEGHEQETPKDAEEFIEKEEKEKGTSDSLLKNEESRGKPVVVAEGDERDDCDVQNVEEPIEVLRGIVQESGGEETLIDAEEIMEKEEKEEDTSECSLKEEEIKGKPVVVAEGDECGGSSFERVDEPIVMSRGVVQESGGEEGVINFGAEDNLVRITRKLMEEIRDEQMSEGVEHAYEDKDITDSQDGKDLEFNGEVNKKNEEEEQMKDMRKGVEMRIELIEDVNEGHEQETPKDAEEFIEKEEKEKGTSDSLLKNEESRGKPVVVAEGDERDDCDVQNVEEPIEVLRGIVQESGGEETLIDAEEIMEKEEKEEDTSECSLKEEEIKGKPVVVAEGDECGGSSFERVDEPIVMSRGVVQESGGEEGVINFGAEDNLVRITRKLMEEIRDEQMSEGVEHAYEDKDITDSQDGKDLEFNGEVNKKNEEEEQMKDMRKGVEMRIELIEDVNEGHEQETPKDAEEFIEKEEKEKGTSDSLLKNDESRGKPVVVAEGDERDDCDVQNVEEPIEVLRGIVQESGGEEKIDFGEVDLIKQISDEQIDEEEEEPFADRNIDKNVKSRQLIGEAKSQEEIPKDKREEGHAAVIANEVKKKDQKTDSKLEEVVHVMTGENKKPIVVSNMNRTLELENRNVDVHKDADGAGERCSHEKYEIPGENRVSSYSEDRETANCVDLSISGGSGSEKDKSAFAKEQGLYSEEPIWQQIDALRTIVGYKGTPQANSTDEIKALYTFIGVDPPASFEHPSDLAELNKKLKFLMSIVGVK